MSLDLDERAPIYAWLAERLVREIDREDWRRMGSEPMRSVLGRLDDRLQSALDADLTSADTDALAEEFTRLFLLPGGVSPLTSNWVAGESERDSTRSRITDWIEQSYLALGRMPVQRPPWGKLPVEHLAAILDLVATSTLSGSELDLEIANDLERDLLAPALDGFGTALAEQARLPVYRAIGLVIQSLGKA